MKKKEKNHGLLKAIILCCVIAFVLTWIIPNGGLATSTSMKRLGLTDLSFVFYHALYYSLDKIILLFTIGGLYGVLTKTSAYYKLTSNIAKKLSKHKTLFVVLVSVLIALLTSVIAQGYVLIIFIPFIISIMNRMKLDKITVLSATFGALLVGTMGATYGSEGVVYLNQYFIGTTPNILKDTLLVRAGILLVGLVLFNFFTVMHMKKTTDNNEIVEDIFLEEKEDESKINTSLPIVVILGLMFIITILGYVNWADNFGIEIFNTFHEKLTTIEVGKGFFLFRDLLGTQPEALGTWELVFSMASIVLIFTVILGLCYKFKLDEFFDAYISGMKKVLKPIACVVAAWVLMVIVYLSPYVATIIGKILGLTDGFNLATMTLSGLITNIFHTDLGFSGYILSSHLVAEYADHIKPIYIMLVSLYGFVQFFIPTSAILGIGVTSLNVKYKDWLKYIWKFVLGMFVCLIVIFALLTII